MEKELEQKFRVFEKQIIQIQEQLQAVEQAILDMTKVSYGVEELRGKKDQEIFAPIGRGIYVKAKLLDEELLVDVGEKNFIKKSIPETTKIILDQKEKLEEIKSELENELENINEELTKVFMEYQKTHAHEPSHDSCSCGDNCSCEEEEECGCGHSH